MTTYNHQDWLRSHVEPSAYVIAAMADLAALWHEAAALATDLRTQGVADAVAACFQHAHHEPSRDTYIAALTASRVTRAAYPTLDVMLMVPSWGMKGS